MANIKSINGNPIVLDSSGLESNAVTTQKIADNAVIGDKINDLAVRTSKLADNAVTTEKIAPNTITYADISVTGTDRIHQDNINDNAVNTRVIADNAVTTSKLADGAATPEKISEGLLDAIAYSGGTTDYDHDLGGNYINNTNRWFLYGVAHGIPRKVYVQSSGAGVIRIDLWRVNNGNLILSATKRNESPSSGWSVFDFSDVASGLLNGDYMVSVITAPNNVKATIKQSGGSYDSYRTTDMTSTTLAISDLLTFEGLCVNGYIEYQSKTIADRVLALEEQVMPSGDSGNTLIVKPDGNGDYTTIADAVNAAVDGNTILVYAGTYEEPIEAWSKTVHIIGIDRDSCIIVNHTGDYATPAVEISSGSIRNMTIISDASSPTIPSSTWGYMLDYCIHADHASSVGKTLVIDNCKLWNNHRTAIGCGLYDHNTVTVSNCEIWSGKPDGYHPDPNSNRRGAVYFHNREPAAWFSNVTEQLVVLANNIIMCDDGIAAYIKDTTTSYDMEELGYVNEMSMRFFNNVFVAKDASGNYKTNDIIGGDGFTQYIEKESISFGNNASQFNGS